MADKKKAEKHATKPDAATSSRSHRDMGSSSQGDGASETDRNARSGTVESGSSDGSPASNPGNKGGNIGNR